jgi:probable F420-dependent oxidoreductase
MQRRRIRVGVTVPQMNTDYRTWRRTVLAVEEAGADAIFCWDHFFPTIGDPSGSNFECLSLVASMATFTERAEIGPLVLSNSYRNPHLVADMARTIDHISGGRFVLGLGAGWYEKDYAEYGYDLGSPGERLRALEANLSLIKDRLAQLNPPPLRRMPLMIGGTGEKVTLRIVAEHADIWQGLGDADTIVHKSRVLDDWCARVGRDPLEIERSGLVNAPEGRHPASFIEDTYERKGLQDPDELVDAGITFLVYAVLSSPHDLAPVRDLIAWRDRRNAQ